MAAPHKGSITDGPFGSNLARQHYRDSGPRVVRLQNIGDGVFIDNPAHIDHEHFTTLRRHEVIAGDLLVASLGEVLPRACLMPAGLGPAIVKADCIRVRLRDDVDPRWVNYSLQRPATRKWAEGRRHGVGRPRLGLKGIREIPIPLPSLRDQRRFVEILEDHLSHLDAGQASLRNADVRMNGLVASRINSLLDTADGQEVALGTLAQSVRNGIFVSRASTEPTGVPILRIGAVRPLALNLSDLRYSGRGASDLMASDALLDPGDLLFTRYNGNPRFVGASAVVDRRLLPLTYPDKLIRVRVDQARAIPEFVCYATNFGRGRRQIDAKLKTSAGQVGISGGELKTISIGIPRLEIQQGVVDRVQKILDARSRLKSGLEKSLSRSEDLRRAVLSSAFEGKLTGRSADQEVIESVADVQR
ncbi:hypothetical protein [Nostocoides vanveenii]|uniref:hypothetical protein n=1 Tax=Nostocoides vanveenii TaxID=330835 RepID=UPI0031DC90FA